MTFTLLYRLTSQHLTLWLNSRTTGHINRWYSSEVQFWIKAESDPLNVHKKQRPDRSRLLLHSRSTTVKFKESRTRRRDADLQTSKKKKKKSWTSRGELLKNTWAVLLFCSINKCVSSSLQDTGWWRRCGEPQGWCFHPVLVIDLFAGWNLIWLNRWLNNQSAFILDARGGDRLHRES